MELYKSKFLFRNDFSIHISAGLGPLFSFLLIHKDHKLISFNLNFFLIF